MKKYYWVIAIILLVAGISKRSELLELSARGSASNSNTLEFMQWWQPEMKKGTFEQMIAEFEKANTGIKVKVISLPYSEVQNQIVVGAASGSISDVIGIDGAWIHSLRNL